LLLGIRELTGTYLRDRRLYGKLEHECAADARSGERGVLV
jgi:hypothetical protein